MDKNIIRTVLKANRQPFGLMDPKEQKEARDIGVANFDYYSGQNSGGWESEVKDDFFRYYRTYRLCPDYKDEPEIEKCEIVRQGGNLCDVQCFFRNGVRYFLYKAVGFDDFIGFLYEDDEVNSNPVGYVDKGGVMIDYATLDTLIKGARIPVRPTHVLFSK